MYSFSVGGIQYVGLSPTLGVVGGGEWGGSSTKLRV